MFYKENYGNAATTKVLHVSLLKVFYVFPEFLEPPQDLARWQKGERFDEFTEEYKLRIDALGYPGKMKFNFHSDFIDVDYRYTEEYGHEISEDIKKTVLEAEGILQQVVCDVVIYDCNFEVGASAEELANSVPWTLHTYHSFFGEDLFTKIFSTKFSSSFFTKCAILSDVYTNHAEDESLAEFVEYNDIGLPLAQRVNAAEEISDLDEDDQDNFDYIEETWEQLCETLDVDKDGDYISLSDMKLN
jgi:hypothetical protein